MEHEKLEKLQSMTDFYFFTNRLIVYSHQLEVYLQYFASSHFWI